MSAAGRGTGWWLGVVGVVQAFVLSLLFLQNIFQPGYLLHNDFITPLRYTPLFFERFLSAWDPVVGGFSYSYPKLSFQAPIALLTALGLSTALLYKLVTVFILGLLGATVFYLVYRITTERTTAWRAYAGATFASLLAMTNPWTLNKIHHHFWLVLGVALLPLIYLLYVRALEGRGGLPTLLALSGLFALEATQPHSLFIYAAPVVVFTALVFVLESPSVSRLGSTLRVSAKLFVLAVLINLFWVLPLGLYYLNSTPTPGSYLMTVENVLSLSRDSSILRASQLRSGIGMKGLVAPGYAVGFRTGIGLLDRLWTAIGAGIIGFSILGLLVDRASYRRERLTFAAILGGSLLLLTGTNPPLGDLYLHAAMEFPMGWMLRDPFKFGGLFVVGLSGLFGITVTSLLDRFQSGSGTLPSRLGRRRPEPLAAAVRAVRRPLPDRVGSANLSSVVLVGVLLLATGFHGWPLLTGDLNDHFEPSTLPEDYDRTLDWLDENVEDSRVAWLPYASYSVADPRVFRFNWTQDRARWHVRGSKFLEFSTPAPVMPQNPQNKRLVMWLNHRLSGDTIERPSVPLSTAGVGYVVYHTDVNARIGARRLLDRMRAAPSVEEVFASGDLHILRVDGGSVLRAGTALETYDLDNLDTVYQARARPSADATPAAFTFRSDVDNRSGVVSSGTAPSLYLPVGKTLTPFDHTDSHSPNHRWSKAEVQDPLQGRWHSYLAQRNSNSWQTDFGEGMAFTWVPQRMPEGVSPSSEDRLGQWRFVGYNVPPGWESLDSGQNISVTSGHLRVALDESSHGWKRVASPAVDASGNETYLFSLDVTGRNAHGAHVKIAEYDADGELLHTEKVTDLPQGDFSRDGVTVDYVPKNASTASLRLQVWHGHRTGLPLPNVLRLDDVNVYEATDYAERSTLTMNVTVDESGEYRLFGRYFANRNGGRVRVTLDGEPATAWTRASFDRFVWSHLATRNLSAGTHTVTIENVDGFNAVNLLKLIPTDDFEANRVDVARDLQDKPVIYHLDGQGDLRSSNAEAVTRERDGAVRPMLSLGTGGEAWRNVTVPRSGEYTVEVHGSGQFQVHVGDRTYWFDEDEPTARQFDAVALAQGSHRLSVEPARRLVERIGFEEPDQYTGGKSEYTVYQGFQEYSGDHSLRVSTTTTERNWSWVYTEPVNVTAGNTYEVAAHLKYRNVNQSHVVLEGYDRSADRWRRLALVAEGQVGTADWRRFATEVTVPEEFGRLRFALNTGWVDDERRGLGVTWFDDVSVSGVQPNTVDSITLASTPDGQSVDEVLYDTGDVATVVDSERHSATHYEARVNASGPHMLSFGEGYDSLWVAEVQTPEGVRTYRPTTVGGTTNGFWIDQTGEYTVTIRYRGQRWLHYGAALSGLVLLGSLTVVGRRRRWHEHPTARRAREIIGPAVRRAREIIGPAARRVRDSVRGWRQSIRNRRPGRRAAVRERVRQGREHLQQWARSGKRRLGEWVETVRNRGGS